MRLLPKALFIILALLLEPCLIPAQLAYEPFKIVEESHSVQDEFTSPSPLNMEEVKTAIQYPEEAQEAGLEGMVICKILVDERGKYVQHIVAIAPDELLGEAVSPHLARLRFAPAKKNEIPVTAWTTVKFDFRLTEDFSVPKPGRKMQIQIWEQAAEAQLDTKDYPRALELFEKAIALHKGQVPNELLDKAAVAAILANDLVQARLHLTNLLYQCSSPSEKARVLYMRAMSAEIQGKVELSARDQVRVTIIAPGFVPDAQDTELFASLAKR